MVKSYTYWEVNIPTLKLVDDFIEIEGAPYHDWWVDYVFFL